MYLLAKTFILVGIFLTGLGHILLPPPRVLALGKLAGSTTIRKRNIAISFPITIASLVSAVLTFTMDFWLRR